MSVSFYTNIFHHIKFMMRVNWGCHNWNIHLKIRGKFRGEAEPCYIIQYLNKIWSQKYPLVLGYVSMYEWNVCVCVCLCRNNPVIYWTRNTNAIYLILCRQMEWLERTFAAFGIYSRLRRDCKPYPHNIKLVNFRNIFLRNY